MAALRSEFPILARRNYLNSCSLGALSHRAVGRVQQFHNEWHELGASGWYVLWMARLAELRARVAAMINADAAELALAASTSAALTSVGSALDYRKKPQIVMSELDFPTVAYQWMVQPGVEIIRVKSDDGITVDPQRFADAVTDRTAAVITSHVYFTTGAIQDLQAVAEIAHAKQALFIVDAYQSAGQIPIDVKAADVDILTTGPLKWLLGGPGVAYLYVRSSLATLQPTVTGWFGADEQFGFDSTTFRFKDDARRFEMGTPALPTVHTALGGQEIIDEVGMHAIHARNTTLTTLLIDTLTNTGFHTRSAPAAQRSAIVMVSVPDPAAVVAALAARDIIVDWRPGYVRFSPHFYNTEEEVIAAAAALADVSAPVARR